MGGTLLGIDFSGGAAPWRPRCANPTVWIARAEQRPDRLRLLSLEPVQALAGDGTPFDRLAALLAAADYDVAAVDAPFAVPERHWPPGGREALLAAVAALPAGPDRPFPTGPALIALAAGIAPLASAKPLRPCERVWQARGVNTRSTLWWTPRGGAPFAAACLALIARSGRPCWPWSPEGPGLLAEAFPAALLRHWGLPHEGYGGAGGVAARREIVAAIGEAIALQPAHAALAIQRPDALDAILCSLAAEAVATGRLALPPDPTIRDGWIAVPARRDAGSGLRVANRSV